MKITKKLETALEKFLAERRKSRGGYAEVTDADMKDLRQIFVILREAKCERDPDGDIPIEIDLINRKTHQPINFFHLQYPHKLKDEDLSHELDLRMSNVQMAMSDLEHIIREMKYREEDRKKKEAVGAKK